MKNIITKYLLILFISMVIFFNSCAVVGGASVASFNTLSGIANGQSGSELVKGHFKGMAFGSISGGVGAGIGGMIGGVWGAFAGGVVSNLTSQGLNYLEYKNSENIIDYKFNWFSTAISGMTSFASYYISGSINYLKYKNSGVTFDGHTLSYRQFMGMSADFQRSIFWEQERGAFLVGEKYIRYPAKTRYKYGVDILNSKSLNESWATFHTHWDEPGIRLSNGDITVQYHSKLDFDGDIKINRSSIVINKYDASFNSISGKYTTVFSSPFYRYPFNQYYYYGY
jgi:hypothetical protein